LVRPRVHDQDTADALVESAARLLAEGGPGAVSVRRVAIEVGVSTRAVYSLFGSRDDLLADLARRGFEGLHRELTARAPTDDPLADLQALGEAYRRSAAARPNLYSAMFQWTPATGGSAGTTESDRTFGILESTAARCVEAGLLAGDPLLLARQLWALTHGLVLLEAQGRLGDDPDDVWDHALRAIAIGNVASRRP